MNIFNPKDRQAIQSQSFKELDNEIPLKGISKSDLKNFKRVVEPVEFVEEKTGGNKYILPIAIGVGVISIVAIIYLLRKK
jgi:LPXTG-motif cell wall-anchored protein